MILRSFSTRSEVFNSHVLGKSNITHVSFDEVCMYNADGTQDNLTYMCDLTFTICRYTEYSSFGVEVSNIRSTEELEIVENDLFGGNPWKIEHRLHTPVNANTFSYNEMYRTDSRKLCRWYNLNIRKGEFKFGLDLDGWWVVQTPTTSISSIVLCADGQEGIRIANAIRSAISCFDDCGPQTRGDSCLCLR